MIRRSLRLLAVVLVLAILLALPVVAGDDPVTGRGVAGENMPLQDMPKGNGKAAPEERPEGAKYGIDVSCWQGMIDWDTAADQIDFAIIRCGYGQNRTSQDDEYWHRNADACERLGIPYGVYLYSYALSEENALSEAQHVLRLLEGHNPTLPIYLDLEDMGTVATLSDEQILRHVTVFCEAIEEAGYTAGVYTFYNWWIDRLNAPEYDAWDRWIAVWSDEFPEYDRAYGMWQFSSTGIIDGIKGEIDENYWFGELPVVEPNGKPKPCDGDETCPCHGFSDTPDWRNWAHPGIDYCVARGLMKGVREDLFLPQGNMTRAQLVTILYRAAGSPAVEHSGAFSDVPEGQWYSKAVEWAADNGIVNGVGDGRFLPGDVLTREQLATILYRCSGAAASEGTLEAFPDGEEVGSYAREALCWATETDLINGIPRDEAVYLCPRQSATRAQTASLIMRFLDMIAA
ncbi:MAG: hypothetical protein E7464_00165 [Ruminococcaceae bacterium]|nr:hypothetical protein [Oscillospiraceae bacterium]